jgi:SAM-dependent methyltransferase
MEHEQYILFEQVEERMWWFHAHRKNLIYFLKKFERGLIGPILDAGCATGGFLKVLGECYPDREIHGLDIEPFAAVRAQERSGKSVICGSVNSLPINGNSISAVISSDILYHQQVDPDEAVEETVRILEPGGIFVVTVPAYEWLSSSHDERVHGARRYTRGQLQKILEKAGFKVTYITYLNTLLFPLMVLRRKIIQPKNDESDVKLFPPLIDAMFRMVMGLEHLLIRMGLTMPFGGSLLAVGRMSTPE